MSAIQRKLKSRQGASITFALLIFLVCAVVSSSVILAASTAGGRLSTVQEMDQRYYGVIAATEVLRGKLDGKNVLLSYQKSGDAKTVLDAPDTLLGKASKAVIERQGSEKVEVLSKSGIKLSDEGEYTCDIVGSLQNGLLTFDISVTGGKINKDGKYEMLMVFASAVMEEEDSVPSGTTGKAKVSWSLSSINKFKG